MGKFHQYLTHDIVKTDNGLFALRDVEDGSHVKLYNPQEFDAFEKHLCEYVAKHGQIVIVDVLQDAFNLEHHEACAIVDYFDDSFPPDPLLDSAVKFLSDATEEALKQILADEGGEPDETLD